MPDRIRGNDRNRTTLDPLEARLSHQFLPARLRHGEEVRAPRIGGRGLTEIGPTPVGRTRRGAGRGPERGAEGGDLRQGGDARGGVDRLEDVGRDDRGPDGDDDGDDEDLDQREGGSRATPGPLDAR